MSEYYQAIIDRGGGLITIGGHLGVMVSPNEQDMLNCPPSWGFLLLKDSTVERIKDTVEQVKKEMEDVRKQFKEGTYKRVGNYFRLE